jgi:hypothetical protein
MGRCPHKRSTFFIKFELSETKPHMLIAETTLKRFPL